MEIFKEMSKLPKFADEEEESVFWDTHDATEYFDETVEEDVTFVDARKTTERKPASSDSQSLAPNP